MALPSLSTRIAERRRGHAVAAVDGELRRLSDLVRSLPEFCRLLDALPDMMLVLSARRQIVFANQWLVRLLGLAGSDALLGLLPGDVLDCVHAWEGVSPSCGDTEACSACGTGRSVSASQNGHESTHECRILQAGTGLALDLRVSTQPLHLNGEPFTLLILKDIANEKRRQALERLFFHDVLNLTASIMGYAELLTRVRSEEIPELSRLIARLIAELAGEIRAQRDLMLAERDDLKVQWETVGSRTMLMDAVHACRSHEIGDGKRITAAPDVADVSFPSDRSLLLRVLCNLIKNALEASPPDGVVTVGCTTRRSAVEFWVHNPGTMPREVQLQVFQRSFSTKGPGRGLGTYSIKLLTERYLGGAVSFSTSSEAGTRFTVRYPRSQRARP